MVGASDLTADLLRSGDVLAISVYNHPELELAVRVGDGGAIRVPLVGKVKAAGVNVEGLAEELGVSWHTVGIADAFVTINVTSYAPRDAYVIGQVRGGGETIALPTAGSLTAMQAIISAGGFAEDAELPRAAVLRTVDGVSKRLAIDAVGFANAVPGADDVVLQPGDIVVVPRAKSITVLGMVEKPGTFNIDTAGKVFCSQAVGLAGGFSENADLPKVAVLRTVDGESKRLSIDAVGFANAVPGADDVALEPGDIVVIPRAKPITILGMVENAGTFNIDTAKQVFCSHVIGLAGGFQKDAVRDNVLILRQNEKGGHEERIVVDVSKVLRGEFAADIPVLPGDTVVVKQAERVFVCGQVENPGALDLDHDVPLTIMRAITLCGGFTEFANKRKVTLIRKRECTEVDLQDVLLESSRIDNDLVLETGDMLFVRESIW